MLLSWSLPAVADDKQEGFVYETVVTSHRVTATDEVTGFAETVEVKEEAKSLRSASEVLSESVGVQTRTTGGLGSFGAVSIRGSTSSQVPIFLDGVLLNVGGFSSVNLGELSLDVLDSIEIYRGAAPVSLGVGGIGGAIALKTRSFERPMSEAAVSYGSWNSWRLMALHGNRVGPVSALALLSAQGSDGDFRYFNHNGTIAADQTSDDLYQRRENNAHQAGSGLFKLDYAIGQWRLGLLDDLFAKRQGVAGMGNLPVEHASLRSLRNTLNLRAEGPIARRTDLRIDLNYLAMNQDFDDLEAEVTIGRERVVSVSHVAGGALLFEVEPAIRNKTSLRAASHYEQYGEQELLREEHSQSYRVRTELAAEHEWRPVDRLKLVPALRAELHSSGLGQMSSYSTTDGIDRAHRFDYFLSPSLGIRFEALEGLVLRANGGRYARPPDLYELFGHHGAVDSNPELKAEIGINADAGITYLFQRIGPLDRMRIDAAWFGTWVDDLIAYVQNSQNTVRPENVSKAEIQGLESGLSLSLFQIVTLRGNYTFLHGIDQSDNPNYRGKHIPGRPVHEAFGELRLGKAFRRWGAEVWFNVDYAGESYLTRYNDAKDVVAHTFLGLGGRISLINKAAAHGHTPLLSFTVEATNLLDAITLTDSDGVLQQVRDYQGFPLPGRTVIGTIHWEM